MIMTQWEYMVRKVVSQLATARLKQYGLEGWALVSVHPTESVASKWEYIFIRELATDDNDNFRKGES
jgi:hypothetical protein|tara:strand:+ start:448 stop:648 length:201 start_codon:yes stop_codon:yes gene_type:complete